MRNIGTETGAQFLESFFFVTKECKRRALAVCLGICLPVSPRMLEGAFLGACEAYRSCGLERSLTLSVVHCSQAILANMVEPVLWLRSARGCCTAILKVAFELVARGCLSRSCQGSARSARGWRAWEWAFQGLLARAVAWRRRIPSSTSVFKAAVAVPVILPWPDIWVRCCVATAAISIAVPSLPDLLPAERALFKSTANADDVLCIIRQYMSSLHMSQVVLVLPMVRYQLLPPVPAGAGMAHARS